MAWKLMPAASKKHQQQIKQLYVECIMLWDCSFIFPTQSIVELNAGIEMNWNWYRTGKLFLDMHM